MSTHMHTGKSPHQIDYLTVQVELRCKIFSRSETVILFLLHKTLSTMMLVVCYMWWLTDSSPKNQNCVTIYLPSSCSKPIYISLFCWTQRKIV